MEGVRHRQRVCVEGMGSGLVGFWGVRSSGIPGLQGAVCPYLDGIHTLGWLAVLLHSMPAGGLEVPVALVPAAMVTLLISRVTLKIFYPCC